MSVYEYSIAVPAATTANAPVTQVLKLEHGIIHRLILDFPAGCNNEVLLVLDRGLHQAFPANPDGQFRGNFWPKVFDTWYPLEEAPYEIKARAWSPNAAYAHTIRISLAIDRREVLLPAQEQMGFLSRLQSLMFGGGK